MGTLTEQEKQAQKLLSGLGNLVLQVVSEMGRKYEWVFTCDI